MSPFTQTEAAVAAAEPVPAAYDRTDADLERDAIARSYIVDDPAIRAELDGIARVAAKACGSQMGVVSLVTRDGLIFIGKAGLALSGIDRMPWSFCDHAMYHAQCMVVGDASTDPRFVDNPLVAGEPNIRFYAGEPLRSMHGAPLGNLCVMDSAARTALAPDEADALRTLARLAMELLERWRASQRPVPSAPMLHGWALDRRFETLADALPQLVWATPPDGMSDYFSTQWCEYTGAPASASYGTGWLGFVHPDDVPMARAAWDAAVARGSDYSIEYRLRAADGAYRWMLARGLPVKDDAGVVTRWIGTCTDIDERVRTGEILELMSQELTHRIKNLFAVVQSLVAISLRGTPELAPTSQALQARIVALGRAHDLIRPRIIGSMVLRSQTPIQQLIQRLIAPHVLDDHTRVTVTGDDPVINEAAATPLSLFLHEMTTNSAKYGALSQPEGTLSIAVTDSHPADGGQSDGPQNDGHVTIEWRETGGPPIARQPEPGFGARLARTSIERQLRGTLDAQWHSQGLAMVARIPRAQMLAN